MAHGTLLASVELAVSGRMGSPAAEEVLVILRELGTNSKKKGLAYL